MIACLFVYLFTGGMFFNVFLLLFLQLGTCPTEYGPIIIGVCFWDVWESVLLENIAF